MRIIGNNRNARTVYAWQDGDWFFLSPFSETKAGRRPMDHFDSREELEAHVAPRGCEVKWLTN